MFHSKFARRYPLMMTDDDTSGGGGGGGGDPAVSRGDHASLDNGQGGQPGAITNPWDTLPRSWTQDMIDDWKAAPEKVRQFVHRREADVEKGIRGYADSHGRWQKLSSKFQDFTQEMPDLDVGGLYEALAENHLALVKADPATRKELFMRMAQHYGVDFAQAAAGQPGAGAAAGAAPDTLTPGQIAQLRQLFGPLMQTVQSVQQERMTEKEREAGKAVDSFFRDPKNKYVNEVGPLMGQIIKARQAATLEEAYELAVMRTPAVKAKFLAELAAGGGSATNEGDDPLNVKSNGAPASTGKGATIDDTMRSVAAKYYAKQ